jgi:acyl carrier protein
VPDKPDAQALAALCAEVVGVASVTPDSNFFEVGGDSVTAARFAVLAEERWGLDIDIMTIFTVENFREMYAEIVAEQGSGRSQ